MKKAIAYFEDAVRESDEIIADCSPALQAELTEQKGHFVLALEIMRRAQPANEPLALKQPEVVRCKDCKYFTDKGVCTFYSVFKNDGSYLSMQFMDDDDFCSYGERKDGDSNDK